jgi:hypothetical protein
MREDNAGDIWKPPAPATRNVLVDQATTSPRFRETVPFPCSIMLADFTRLVDMRRLSFKALFLKPLAEGP